MREVAENMLRNYNCKTAGDYEQALREIFQSIALLGLWRSKFFEHAAFYGGTALRILYGLDRYSEDLDFSLVKQKTDFRLDLYSNAIDNELKAFGFNAEYQSKSKKMESPIQSAFINAETHKELARLTGDNEIVRGIFSKKILRIKLEIDTNPPLGFNTEMITIRQPIPFPARTYTLPDLFAGKMHAILCRKWKNRVKGRDWYDFIWFISRYPELHLSHLECRLRQSNHWTSQQPLDKRAFETLLSGAIERLDVKKAKQDVETFILDTDRLDMWSNDYFYSLIPLIEIV